MDANQLRFGLLAEARHFPARLRTVWDSRCRVLKLASERRITPPADAALALSSAASAMERVPRTLDANGSLARWIEEADDAGNIGWIGVRSAHLPGEALLLRLPSRPSDLAVGHDGVLYIALEDGVMLHDLRGRWRATTLRQAGFAPWRIATAATGGCWLLDRASGRLARLHGLPLAERPHANYAPTTFRPHQENPCPPTIRVLANARLAAGERAIAIAAQARRGLALLSWTGDGEAQLRLLDTQNETLGPPARLDSARHAYALEWLDAERVALRLPGRRDAPAWPLDAGENDALRAPLGEIYPIAEDGLEAPFVHRLDGPPHYPTALGAVPSSLGAVPSSLGAVPSSLGAEPLHCLSIVNLARRGEAASFEDARPHLLDSGSQQTVWHRLYAEASIPAGTGFIAWLAATAEPAPPGDASAWCAHRFGRGIPSPAGPQEPQAAWEAMPSELPGHPGLGPWQREAERAGLYSVLIQNSRQRVRALVGRYLWVRLELFGDGRAGPEIAALRAWQSRYSYRDKYLPRIFRETLHGTPALVPGERLDGLEPALAPLLDAGGTPPTALAERLGARVDATVVLEETDNPFLADFYADRPGAALQAQLFYLLNRHRQQTALRQTDLFSQLTISDYLFDKDKIFAYLNLDDNELFIYQRLYELLARDVPPPDLVVYLQSPTDVLLRRVHSRRMDAEAVALQPDDEYLRELNEAYHHFFFHYNATPLLVVETSQFDSDASD